MFWIQPIKYLFICLLLATIYPHYQGPNIWRQFITIPIYKYSKTCHTQTRKTLRKCAHIVQLMLVVCVCIQNCTFCRCSGGFYVTANATDRLQRSVLNFELPPRMPTNGISKKQFLIAVKICSNCTKNKQLLYEN